MNKDRVQGRWKQLKGKVKEQWGKLTDDDLDVIAGRRDQLLGRIQQRHGLARDEAERQVRSWERTSPDHALDDSPTLTDKSR
ncbi:MAG TPA: CsbD family protein [Ramlibacter sp.]|nr:CsbD family protein [Ramlibacter sp.]